MGWDPQPMPSGHRPDDSNAQGYFVFGPTTAPNLRLAYPADLGVLPTLRLIPDPTLVVHPPGTGGASLAAAGNPITLSDGIFTFTRNGSTGNSSFSTRKQEN